MLYIYHTLFIIIYKNNNSYLIYILYILIYILLPKIIQVAYSHIDHYSDHFYSISGFDLVCMKSAMYKVSRHSTVPEPPHPTKQVRLLFGPARISELSTRKSQCPWLSFLCLRVQETKHGVHFGVGGEKRVEGLEAGFGLKYSIII